LTACNQSGSTANDQKTDTLTSKVSADTLNTDEKKSTKVRLSFKNIDEVVKDEKSNAWVEFKDSTSSLALRFNLDYKDTLAISYSPECWLMYPYKIDENKIVVYWDNNIDTKYDFDIVKAINKTDKKYIGQPFMTLELINDTTLKATYPFPNLIKKLIAQAKSGLSFQTNMLCHKNSFYDDRRKNALLTILCSETRPNAKRYLQPVTTVLTSN